jgi:folate-binding protein YgfZ
VEDAAAQAGCVRRGAGLFRLDDRGAIEVRGGERVRWLDGMLTNDVRGLRPDGPRSGCHALLLTREGRIVADLRVLAFPDHLLLELPRQAAPAVIERLGRYVIADDVSLADASPRFARLGLEGPRAPALLAAAAGQLPALEADAHAGLIVGGVALRVAAFGFSGEPAFQIFAPAGAGDAVAEALHAAAGGLAAGTLVDAGPDALEVLRVEAGMPAPGRELDESVLPAEARLESAISTTKGCFTGQEVVTRMRSRGRVSHLLVGLRFPGDTPPAPGTALCADGGRVGSVTSSVRSARFGSIGLGFVARAQADPGTLLEAGGLCATVSTLPFIAGGAAG